jgi:C-terminal processing protease CtpA/Prc
MAKRKASSGRGKKAATGASAAGAAPQQPKMSASATRSAAQTLIGQRIKLADYRSTVPPLGPQDRDVVIDQAIVMLEQIYAHLPLKRALHANDPIQSLRLLRLRQAALDERAFQSALMEIFLGLRDLHTNYILPTVYAEKFAYLPFRIEEFYEPGGVASAEVPQSLKYVVSWVSRVNTIGTLKEGMIVTHWNGSPIDLAVARNGVREAGSNADARRAQGIEALTLRWLGMSLPPDEDWVNLTYTDGTKIYESRFDWEVIDASDRPALLAGLGDAAGSAPTPEAPPIGLDLKRLLLDRARKLIFNPRAVEVEREARAHLERAAVAAPPPPQANTSLFPDVFPRFEEVKTPSGNYGYIRLKSFAPTPADISGVVAEFGRILSTLPQTGLILDVRGNGGGYVNIGERILQMLTPRRITPEPFHFLATPLALQVVSEPRNGAQKWEETIRQGLESGASFSQGFPLTDEDECNITGQVYQGPVVLVTDALCYSTTDIFAAGFQDHEIGTILGCHSSTGAGGANVWDYYELQTKTMKPKNPFGGLPGGATMRVAARRCTRVGSRSGIPVEDYGVVTDVRYFMTKKDVVDENDDLIAAAAKILEPLPKYTLRLTSDSSDPLKTFMIDCSSVDRIDLFVNDRPALSREVSGNQTGLSVPLPFAATAGSILYAKGYREGKLVVNTRLSVGP